MVQAGDVVTRASFRPLLAFVAAAFLSSGPARAQADGGGARPVAELVAQLAAPQREQRLAAQEALLLVSAQDSKSLDDVEPPAGFEARAALDYVRSHRPAPAVPIAVPAGSYRVGCDTARDRNPERSVTLEVFTIDDCEVTCFEYWRFVRATGGAAPPGWIDGRYPYGGERVPVGNVSPARPLDSRSGSAAACRRRTSGRSRRRAARGRRSVERVVLPSSRTSWAAAQ
jgi:formylglycine-generating enzyme required for sulfatase activity